MKKLNFDTMYCDSEATMEYSRYLWHSNTKKTPGHIRAAATTGVQHT